MSKKMNTVVRDQVSDISDCGSDLDDEIVESDPVLVADLADMTKRVQGGLKRHELQLIKSFKDAAKSMEMVESSKSTLKKKFKAKSDTLEECQRTLREIEQSRDFWKTEADRRKVSEEGLKAEKALQASRIQNLSKELEQRKKEMGDMKSNFETKLKESESRYENLRIHLDGESKKWNQANQQLAEKVSALERAKKDLEGNVNELRVQLSNLSNKLERITKENEKVTEERDAGLQRESNLKTEVARRESTIDNLVVEELERRIGCSTINRILFQHMDHYKEMLKKRKVSDVNLPYIMPEFSFSSPHKRSPSSIPDDGTENGGKKRKGTPRGSGHASEEEGEIVNQHPQPQQETTTLATQPVIAPIPAVPTVGAPPQIQGARHVDNGTRGNANARQFQTTPSPTAAMNTFRRHADWGKHGGRGRKN